MRYKMQDILFPTKKSAEEVLELIDKHVKVFGHIAVSDLYILVGFKPTFEDGLWGWGEEIIRAYIRTNVKGIQTINEFIGDPKGSFSLILPSPHRLQTAPMVPKLEDDPVNHPSHYTAGKIEVIDFIIDQKLTYCLGNAVKYISRAGKKDPRKMVEDLKKAVWYTNKQIEILESSAPDVQLISYTITEDDKIFLIKSLENGGINDLLVLKDWIERRIK